MASFFCLCVQSCARVIEVRGHPLDPKIVENVKIHVTDQETVRELLGNPTIISSFHGKIWYYIFSQTEHVAFLKEKMKEHQVVAVNFNVSNIVDSVRIYDLKDVKNVAYVKEYTPTYGHDISVIEQLLGNIGRFNIEKVLQ